MPRDDPMEILRDEQPRPHVWVHDQGVPAVDAYACTLSLMQLFSLPCPFHLADHQGVHSQEVDEEQEAEKASQDSRHQLMCQQFVSEAAAGVYLYISLVMVIDVC